MNRTPGTNITASLEPTPPVDTQLRARTVHLSAATRCLGMASVLLLCVTESTAGDGYLYPRYFSMVDNRRLSLDERTSDISDTIRDNTINLPFQQLYRTLWYGI